jgi:hypothetical protein
MYTSETRCEWYQPTNPCRRREHTERRGTESFEARRRCLPITAYELPAKKPNEKYEQAQAGKYARFCLARLAVARGLLR